MTTTKKLTMIGVVALLAIATFTSCKKYLTEEPTSEFTADFVYNSIDGLESGVVGLYNIQRDFYTRTGSNNGSDPLALDARDDLTLPRAAEIGLVGRMSRGTTPENSGVFSIYWRTYYQIIDRANSIITAAGKLNISEQNRKDAVIGQAKLIRANAIFTLFKLFNNIYVTTEPTTPANADVIILDKTPEADIYKQINEDLTDAIAKLPWTANFGRVTQATARHIKAEVALWQKDWTEAKTQAEAVIKNGAYTLQSSPATVFTNQLNNKETLWALTMKQGVEGGPQRLNFNLMPNYPEQIPGSKYTQEQGGRGFSWLTCNNYLRDLLNAYPNDIRINNTYYIKDYLYNDPETVPNPALLGTKIVHATWREFSTVAENRRLWFVRLTTGCKKYFPETGDPNENNQYKSIPLARLAETFLFAAEANLMLNNIGTIADAPTAGSALGALNAVRARAGIPKVAAITIDSILNEQAKELAFEGRRMYMLKRTGKQFEHITKYAGYGWAGDKSPNNSTAGGANNTPARPLPYQNDARRNFQPHMVNWAIPINDISLLGPNYPQNAGY